MNRLPIDPRTLTATELAAMPERTLIVYAEAEALLRTGWST